MNLLEKIILVWWRCQYIQMFANLSS